MTHRPRHQGSNPVQVNKAKKSQMTEGDSSEETRKPLSKEELIDSINRIRRKWEDLKRKEEESEEEGILEIYASDDEFME